MPENTPPNELSDLYVRADRAASLRTLVRGLIHAIRNPLQTVIIAAGSVREELAGQVDSPPLDLIESETLRLTAAVERLERLFQADSVEASPTSVREVVETVIDMLQYHPPPRLAVHEAVPRALPPVRSRPTDLMHALLNMAVYVERSATDDDDGELRIEATSSPAEVRVWIWGTGSHAATPIPEDVFRFGPGESPLPPLAVARHLAERNGATLRLETDGPGPHARLCLAVPVWRDE